ncbi:MAG: glycosyltransferase family 4 protein [Planctomycetes bacterium]|nr:glycosyltransferase family 4 protein [Planctomycetota bacterium]
MKLAYVVHQFLPRYFSGTEQYVLAMAQEMRRRGHSVEIFALDPEFERDVPPLEERRDEVEGLPVQRITYWRRLHPNPVRAEYDQPYVGTRFGAWLDERKPDLVHFFHLRYLGGNLIEEASRRGLPSVVHLMDFWFLCPVYILLRADGSLCDGPPQGGMGCFPCVNADLGHALRSSGLFGEVDRLRSSTEPQLRAGDGMVSLYAGVYERAPYLRRALLRASCVIAPSHFLKSVFVKNGIPAERIDVRSYGLDRRRLQSLIGLERESRKDGPLRVGYIGTLSHYKGVHVLLEALRLTAAPLEVRIHGRFEDFPAYSESLKALADGEPRVEFRGPFGVEQLGSVLAEFDLLVVPSLWYENTPFAVLEAFAANVPVLATNLGGMSEIVRQEDNGELFERGNPHDLAARLERLTREPERLDRYRAAIGPAKRIDQSADEIENLYEVHRAAAMAAARGAES